MCTTRFKNTSKMSVIFILTSFNILSPTLAKPQFGDSSSISQPKPAPTGDTGMAKPTPGKEPSGFKSVEGLTSNETVNFYLYREQGATIRDKLILMETDGTVPSKFWNYGMPIKLAHHGYHIKVGMGGIDNIEDQAMHRIGEEYFIKNSSINVIIVDWSQFAIRFNYAEAVENRRKAAKQVADFLFALYNKKSFEDWSLIHVIGFSLGCHVSGTVGFLVQDMSKGEHKVGRITGLDPAGPMFDVDGEKLPEDLTGFLDKSDADFVDIMHCNMGGLPHWAVALHDGRLGSFVPAGHADFYPNGGILQKHQCKEAWDKVQGCSHRVCVLMYALSVTNPKLACPCNNFEQLIDKSCTCTEETGEYMGDQCRTTAKGKYFLELTDHINMTEMFKFAPDANVVPGGDKATPPTGVPTGNSSVPTGGGVPGGESPKVDQPKVEQPKVEQPKVEQPKVGPPNQGGRGFGDDSKPGDSKGDPSSPGKSSDPFGSGGGKKDKNKGGKKNPSKHVVNSDEEVEEPSILKYFLKLIFSK